MGIDAITEKIVNDAREFAEKTIAEAEAEAEQIISAAELEAEEIRSQKQTKGAKDTTMVIHRKHSAAELEAGRMRLATKQQLVSNAADTAVDWLADMDRKDYIDFLVDVIAETGATEGELVLNARDKKTIGKKVVKASNERLDGGKLVLSDTAMDAKGGFILRYGKVEINATLEVMVASVKERAAPQVIRTLFREHD